MKLQKDKPYRVEWLDAHMDQTDWNTMEESMKYHKEQVMTVITIGHYFFSTDDAHVFYMSRAFPEELDYTLKIPKAAIQKITPLKPSK